MVKKFKKGDSVVVFDKEEGREVTGDVMQYLDDGEVLVGCESSGDLSRHPENEVVAYDEVMASEANLKTELEYMLDERTANTIVEYGAEIYNLLYHHFSIYEKHEQKEGDNG